ncbi:MAG: hypothetical protein QM805_11770 [Pseudomonas sp.]
MLGAAEFAPIVMQRRITHGLINLVAVVGLYVFVGNSGVLSFGNVAFMAIGAYVSALLTMPAAREGSLPARPACLPRRRRMACRSPAPWRAAHPPRSSRWSSAFR